jgi:alkylation response protein AidB-like acyl-CoA dehydrogenase
MNQFRSLGMRLYVHEVLFRESIWAQGTPEQWNKYKDDINTYKIIGCFAMTELGHSSHLPGTQFMLNNANVDECNHRTGNHRYL